MKCISRFVLIFFVLLFSLISIINAQDYSQLANKTLGATVYVEAGKAMGSGFRISDNLIITNYHVIKDKRYNIYVSNFNSKIKYKVSFIKLSSAYDIAILKLSNKDLRYFPKNLILNTNFPKIGSKIFTAGNPYGLQGTFSDGVVSSIRQVPDATVGLPPEMIQITAPIAPGSSGGPLVNQKGEVLGVNTMIYPDAGSIGFSVPSKYIIKLLPSSYSSNSSTNNSSTNNSSTNNSSTNNSSYNPNPSYNSNPSFNSNKKNGIDNFLLNLIVVIVFLGLAILYYYFKGRNKKYYSYTNQQRPITSLKNMHNKPINVPSRSVKIHKKPTRGSRFSGKKTNNEDKNYRKGKLYS